MGLYGTEIYINDKPPIFGIRPTGQPCGTQKCLKLIKNKFHRR